MKYFSFIIICFFSITIQAQDKKVAVTVDDLPVVYYAEADLQHYKTITENLVRIFDEFEIPAIGYVNESKLYTNKKPDPAKIELLKIWLSNGYELGNHTYSHMNYHRSEFKDFTEDVIKGEQIAKKLSTDYGLEYRFFRHPYLRSGISKTHSDSLSVFLNEIGYTEAPVTIDNEDYIFAKAYHIAYNRNDSDLMEKIGNSYIDYMEKKIIHFERVSNDLFGRNISQTLLIHANLLNSEYLDELAQVYVDHGYIFVTQEEVLKDEAYQTEITRFGDWGISMLDRIALSRGKKGGFFSGDPVTPQFVNELGQ
ncbi:MAG: polysaccharide deacetylase family protein [Balneolaceae bacterium]